MCYHRPLCRESDGNTQMTMGSNLELLELASGRRDIIYSCIFYPAPNWTPGLVFNDAKTDLSFDSPAGPYHNTDAYAQTMTM